MKINSRNLIRKTIYQTLGTVDQILNRENNIVIYTYHNINGNRWVFDVSVKQFEEQMKYLSSWGKPVSLADIAQFIKSGKSLPEKCFAVTFDDGYYGILSGIDITKTLNIKPTVFLIGDRKNVSRAEIATSTGLLSKDGVKKIISAGWTIGSHSLTHRKLAKLDFKLAKKEIEKSKKLIELETGKRIDTISYPHGNFNDSIISLAKQAGYKIGVSMNDDLIKKSSDVFSLPRVGVMGTHSNGEFPHLASPSVIMFRKIVKKTFLRNYI